MLQSVEQLGNPGVQLAFAWIVSDRLKNPDRQTILGAIEIKNVLAGVAALLLFPLKQFFNLGVLYDRDSLIVIKKPLDYLGQRVVIDVPVFIATQDG